jgi:hypothetical protein
MTEVRFETTIFSGQRTTEYLDLIREQLEAEKFAVVDMAESRGFGTIAVLHQRSEGEEAAEEVERLVVFQLVMIPGNEGTSLSFTVNVTVGDARVMFDRICGEVMSRVRMEQS